MHAVSIFLAGYLGELTKAIPHLGGAAILRYARVSRLSITTEQCLYEMLGGSAELPLAYYLELGEGWVVDDSQRWLVQPVHLQLQRDTFNLTHVPMLEADAFKACTQLLNDHFSQEAIHFEPSAIKQYWYLRLPKRIKASTHALQHVLGQDVHHFQPSGPDGATLRRIINEAQMLLHEHPVNQSRIVQGFPEINSLWISGGEDAQSLSTNLPLGGDGVLIKGLSVALDLPVYNTVSEVLASPERQAVFYSEHRSAVDWDLLFQQVKFGKIKQLALYVPDGHETLLIKLNTLDCWKFWRNASLSAQHEND